MLDEVDVRADVRGLGDAIKPGGLVEGGKSALNGFHFDIDVKRNWKKKPTSVPSAKRFSCPTQGEGRDAEGGLPSCWSL